MYKSRLVPLIDQLNLKIFEDNINIFRMNVISSFYFLSPNIIKHHQTLPNHIKPRSILPSLNQLNQPLSKYPIQPRPISPNITNLTKPHQFSTSKQANQPYTVLPILSQPDTTLNKTSPNLTTPLSTSTYLA